MEIIASIRESAGSAVDDDEITDRPGEQCGATPVGHGVAQPAE
nr:hypothetical protein [uncultured Actinoplanes sp.]